MARLLVGSLLPNWNSKLAHYIQKRFTVNLHTHTLCALKKTDEHHYECLGRKCFMHCMGIPVGLCALLHNALVGHNVAQSV